MKGVTGSIGSSKKVGSMAGRVGHAKNLNGQSSKADSKRTDAPGGFTASRKKGSVRGH